MVVLSSLASSERRAAADRGTSVDALLAMVRKDGTAGHRYPLSDSMFRGIEAARNVADAVHHFCLLHGRHPSVVDHAIARASDESQHQFMNMLADNFADERGYLAKLVVAVGPLPSTPGQADTETAVLAQHHAIDMLAQSERAGCALGAAVAVVADWLVFRAILNHAAERLSIVAPVVTLPDARTMRILVGNLSMTHGMERAMIFGGQQIIMQHRGLWNLLEARSIAREHAHL